MDKQSTDFTMDKQSTTFTMDKQSTIFTIKAINHKGISAATRIK